MPRIVVLDANALMMPFQFNINLDLELERLLGPCEVLVPSSVIRELEGMQRREKHAKAALALAEKYEEIETSGRGDQGVIDAASSEGGVVVTNDKELIRALKDAGMPVIRMRGKSHLVMER